MKRTAAKKTHSRLPDAVYEKIKQDIFEFRLLPGDRMTETDLAQSIGISRTPVRQALHRLEQEGYLKVAFRNGWNVLPFDFDRFEQLYDLRIILELAAVEHICESEIEPDLSSLAAVWLVPEAERLSDPSVVSKNDEIFHHSLVLATGNTEMARVHQDITEKIRIIRRLDFTKKGRISATYDEHAQILRLIIQRKLTQALILVRAHIAASQAEVRKITLHMLHVAKQSSTID